MNPYDEVRKIPGVAERAGREVLAGCGPEVRGRSLAVLGSVREALLAREWSGDVAYFAHTFPLAAAERERLAERGVRVVEGRVQRLVIVGDRVAGIELDRASVVAPAAIVIPSPSPSPSPSALSPSAPFSPAWERGATEAVLADRRHGLESMV